MGKKLVIVESPAKAGTIKKYLGKDFDVLASYGHIRDLVPKSGAVDPAHNFAMRYEVIERNQKHLDKIEKSLSKADALYLATDPDREGEAISWHIYELMKERNLLEGKPVRRVVFHEITKKAILGAFENTRDISMDLVNAQQARRALDYLVGFTLSPLLWKKIRRGLSAGRVQSPALRMIAERELDIEAFKAQEYWFITANLTAEAAAFNAKLVTYKGEKLSQFSIQNDAQAQEMTQALATAAKGSLTVQKVEKKQRKRQPATPFITSTLQQEAARKLGFTTRRTMSVAQQLYEGIDVGSGTLGLITYMRTDSVHMATEAIDDIRGLIGDRYGQHYLPDAPRVFKTKSKNAQEAHEAIRPTTPKRMPEEIKSYLSAEQFKLYDLIWKRSVASQMIHATIDTVSATLACGDDHSFRANGSTIADPGFLKVYEEGKDDAKKEDGEGTLLPPLAEGQVIPLDAIVPSQHFTEPPPRFSEASLVKTLEEHGIGRPSTYASIIHTLQQREYVTLEKKRFQPTDVGRVVNRFLTEYFKTYVDFDFTAQLEDQLDEVSRGEKEWLPLLDTFWQPFTQQISHVDETTDRSDVTTEDMDEACPKCEKPLKTRLGRRGRFVGCSAYPECDYTRNLDDDPDAEPEIIEDRSCPDCEGPLQIRIGRFGKFIGCGNYPKCKHIEPLVKPADTNVQCPECHEGTILQRKSRRGKIFYSCSRYPDCKYALWNEPVNEPCPKCQWPLRTLKITKRRGTEKLCPQESCKFSEVVEGPEGK